MPRYFFHLTNGDPVPDDMGEKKELRTVGLFRAEGWGHRSRPIT
jgi:hypothetical protein